MKITFDTFKSAASALNGLNVSYHSLDYLERLKFINAHVPEGVMVEFWLKLDKTEGQLRHFWVPNRKAQYFTGKAVMMLKGHYLTDSINVELLNVRYNANERLIVDGQKLNAAASYEFIKNAGFTPETFYSNFHKSTDYKFASYGVLQRVSAV